MASPFGSHIAYLAAEWEEFAMRLQAGLPASRRYNIIDC
jgi:hypothetical protein